jgi:phosphoribosylformylglycinamidine synthase
MKWGVLVFPGSNCDADCVHVLREVLHQEVIALWHEQAELHGVEAVVIPGGFSYGDYLRAGAVAHLAPVMRAVKDFADRGGLVIGICNGFQILTEAGLLPGALLNNTGLRFICKYVSLRVERTDTPFTHLFKPGQVVRMPVAHNEGRWVADLHQLAAVRSQVVLRYCDAGGAVTAEANPNGALENTAGLVNQRGNVLGMMPHPERAAEGVLGGEDGRLILAAMIASQQAVAR